MDIKNKSVLVLGGWGLGGGAFQGLLLDLGHQVGVHDHRNPQIFLFLGESYDIPAGLIVNPLLA